MSTEDDHIAAGEFVLGAIDPADRLEALARSMRDPGFAAAVAFWEDRLAPLASLVPPVTPPPETWARIALGTGVGLSAPRSRVRMWQGATAASMLLAASLAVVTLLPRLAGPSQPDIRFVAALGPLDRPVPFVAEARADGQVLITPVSGIAAPAGRSFQLWEVQPGAAKPVSLGVLESGQTVSVAAGQRPWTDSKLLISDEPAGGSPSGLPTGPVVYGGTLTQAAPPGR